MTDAERSIEPAVAALGVPYRTQFPCFLFGMGKFFPDFILPTIGVVLEVDDKSHNDPEKEKADALRTSALEKFGYVVVRCTNEEAVNDPYGTVNRLIKQPSHLHRKGPGLPPCQFKEKRKKKSNANYNRSRGRTPRSGPSQRTSQGSRG